MAEVLTLAEQTIAVVRKDIQHVHLSVLPPDGRVHASVPRMANNEALRAFIIRKLPWIRTQQRTMHAQEREPARALVTRESHYLWGRRYLLQVREADAPPKVEVLARHLRLTVRPGTGPAARDEILQAWYREQVRTAVQALLPTWEPRLGVGEVRVAVRRMKTRWGSCSPASRTIRLNTDLAKKPRECLEYLVVHELVHFLDRTHGPRFLGLMDRHFPAWRIIRDRLNRLPLAHVEWEY